MRIMLPKNFLSVVASADASPELFRGVAEPGRLTLVGLELWKCMLCGTTRESAPRPSTADCRWLPLTIECCSSRLMGMLRFLSRDFRLFGGGGSGFDLEVCGETEGFTGASPCVLSLVAARRRYGDWMLCDGAGMLMAVSTTQRSKEMSE